MNNLRPFHSYPPRSGAFTLMELMVSVAILVMIILSVGVVFQSASRSVGLSQATLEMLSNHRAVQQQIERDIRGIDKNGFLVIRSKMDVNTKRRFDQIAFISLGDFPNRTGVNTVNAPLTDRLTSNAALVWYGQLAIQSNSPPAAGNYLPSAQGTAVPLAALPSGVNDPDFILGRHTTLLVPPSGNIPPTLSSTGLNYRAYAGAQWSTPNVSAYTNKETPANISCSRIDIAAITAGSLEQSISDYLNLNGRGGAAATYEIDNYCYRFACLRSPYDGESTAVTVPASSIINGYFRMHPILLQGVPSFAIDWTDGTPDATYGLAWYGEPDPTIGVNKKLDPAIEPAAPLNSDDYRAVFSVDQKLKWPKALRFRYHLADPTGRLPVGREFVEVVALP